MNYTTHLDDPAAHNHSSETPPASHALSAKQFHRSVSYTFLVQKQFQILSSEVSPNPPPAFDLAYKTREFPLLNEDNKYDWSFSEIGHLGPCVRKSAASLPMTDIRVRSFIFSYSHTTNIHLPVCLLTIGKRF